MAFAGVRRIVKKCEKWDRTSRIYLRKYPDSYFPKLIQTKDHKMATEYINRTRLFLL